MTAYWTKHRVSTSISPPIYLPPSVELISAPGEYEACTSAMRDRVSSEIFWEGYAVTAERLIQSCWMNLPANWSEDDISKCVRNKGARMEDIDIVKPQDHATEIWLYVTAPVYAARIFIRGEES